MTDATFVSIVPRSKRTKLRELLTRESTAPVQWTEKRGLLGSEFFFSGPPALVRKVHLYVATWLTKHQG